LEILGVPAVFFRATIMSLAVHLLFYGMYFGVVGRDCAEVCAETMASHMGYYTRKGITSRQMRDNACAVCDGSLTTTTTTATMELKPAKEGITARFIKGSTSILDLMNNSKTNNLNNNNNLEGALGIKEEKILRLNCGHSYHEYCLRGWTIVGKKDTCAYCREKVSLKELFGTNPWNAESIVWIKVLDAVRYLVVWNPIILFGCGLLVRFIHHSHSS